MFCNILMFKSRIKIKICIRFLYTLQNNKINILPNHMFLHIHVSVLHTHYAALTKSNLLLLFIHYFNYFGHSNCV